MNKQWFYYALCSKYLFCYILVWGNMFCSRFQPYTDIIYNADLVQQSSKHSPTQTLSNLIYRTGACPFFPTSHAKQLQLHILKHLTSQRLLNFNTNQVTCFFHTNGLHRGGWGLSKLLASLVKFPTLAKLNITSIM